MFRHGTAGQRKALIEANVAEIRFEEEKIIPVFKIPEEEVVRVMEPVVRRQGLEPRTRGLRVRCSAS